MQLVNRCLFFFFAFRSSPSLSSSISRLAHGSRQPASALKVSTACSHSVFAIAHFVAHEQVADEPLPFFLFCF